MKRAIPLIVILCLAGACAPRHTETVKAGPISDVLHEHTDELMRIPGVIGTGEGSEGGERVIVVFVNQRTPELDKQIPPQIGGYHVVVRVTGDVTAPPR